MTSHPSKSARQVALDVLDRFHLEKHDSREILHRHIEQTSGKAHATDLVFGTIRNRPLIDTLILRFSGRDIAMIQKSLLNILRLGVYELVFVQQTSDYAAVNESVNLAHAAAGKKQAGFVNAVMRNISRALADSNANLADSTPARTVPHGTHSGCRFDIDILPDPEKDPQDYLSKAYSLPRWLIDDWMRSFDFAQTRSICAASNRRPSIYLQPNTLRICAADLARKLIADSIECDLVAEDTMIKLRTHHSISTIPGYREGLFTVQDPTAADVMNMIAPMPGWTVLDLCAAPGGKTVRTAQLMNNKGTIYATDIDGHRLKMVDSNCKRLGISIVKTFPWKQLDTITKSVSRFDAIILDVPCSNTGVLARRPEARLRIKQDSVDALVSTQRQLLEQAAHLAAPDTLLCYSTCSIHSVENTDMTKRFLAERPGWKLLDERLTLPFVADDASFGHDGGYFAILAKHC